MENPELKKETFRLVSFFCLLLDSGLFLQERSIKRRLFFFVFFFKNCSQTAELQLSFLIVVWAHKYPTFIFHDFAWAICQVNPY